MNNSYLITKRSGEQEAFSEEKFRHSLLRAGASPDLIEIILAQTLKIKPKTTKDLYRRAMSLLHKFNKPVAARYNLKQALLQLGPAGFPFENFVAEIFKLKGFKTETDATLQGYCVSHEIDVLAHKNHQRYFVECKFHNSLILKTDIKVTLYVKARFEDIKSASPRERLELDQQWIVTNTSFTNQAISYAECVGMNLMGWSYPYNHGLAQTIDHFGLHPITALTSLSRKQKNTLIQNGLVLCNQASIKKSILHELGFSNEQIEDIISEAEQVCKIGAIKI